MSDRHRVEHEVFHVTRDMVRWSEHHVAELARAGREFGLELDPEATHDAGLLEREKRGTWVFYRVSPQPLEALRTALISTASGAAVTG